MRRFVPAAIALFVFPACQPATIELTEGQKAQIEAEIREALDGLWAAAEDRILGPYCDFKIAAFAGRDVPISAVPVPPNLAAFARATVLATTPSCTPPRGYSHRST